MPASRRARAITLAPRSWPSRPGLAMTTRIFRTIGSPVHGPGTGSSGLPPAGRSYEWHFLVFAPDVAQRVAHLADRRIGADTIEQRIHRILAAARRFAQTVERLPYGVAVPGPAQLLEP